MSVCLSVCVSVCVRRCSCGCPRKCVEQTLHLGVILQGIATFLFNLGSPTGLGITYNTRLDRQQDPGSAFLCLPGTEIIRMYQHIQIFFSL